MANSQGLRQAVRDTLDELAIVCAEAGTVEIPETSFDVRTMVPGKPGHASSRMTKETRLRPELLLWDHVPQLAEHDPYDQLVQQSTAAIQRGHQAVGLGGTPPDAMLEQCLLRAGSLTVPDKVIDGVVQEFEAYAASDSVTHEDVWVLERFTAEAPFQLGAEVEIRPILESDIVEYHRLFGGLELRHDIRWLSTDDWLCTAAITRPKNTFGAGNWAHRGGQDSIALALSLAAQGHAFMKPLWGRYKSPFASSYLTSRSQDGPEDRIGVGGENLFLSHEQIAAAQGYFDALVMISTVDALDHLRLPTRRMRLGAQRGNVEDTLVDFVIGLERLLAPDTPQLEVTYRFKLRGAALLPAAEFGDARTRIDLMNKLYDLRSAVVHGRADREAIIAATPEAEEVLRSILQWLLQPARLYGDHNDLIRALDEAMVAGGGGIREA